MQKNERLALNGKLAGLKNLHGSLQRVNTPYGGRGHSAASGLSDDERKSRMAEIRRQMAEIRLALGIA